MLLVAVGIFGIITELMPQINPDFEFDLNAQLLYWLLALLLTLGVGWWVVQRGNMAHHASEGQTPAT